MRLITIHFAVNDECNAHNGCKMVENVGPMARSGGSLYSYILTGLTGPDQKQTRDIRGTD